MSAPIESIYAFFAVLRRDLHVYLSYRTRMVSQLLTTVFSITLFYYVSKLVHISGFKTHNSYFGFVVVGIALIGVIYSCFSLPELFRQELVAGTFDRLLLSPFGAVRSIIAMTLFPLINAFFVASLTLALACLLYGLHLHWSTVPLSVPAVGLALLAFMPFGLLFAALTVVVKQGSIGATWVIALLTIIGGLYFPVALLPHWVQTASKLQPFTPATNVLRHLLVDSPVPGGSVASSLLRMAGFAAVLLPVSLFVLSRSIRFSQRRGTIIEY
ncbi:MAG TPA: ABC transporter permease [Solirubrobacteraceae bacterium]|jgi:ABC-2 type transport system permease protein|nr:ABC transporter permease [Solirubrobacteraceae bacterium]